MTGARRFRHALVLGKFYPLHAGHSHLIRTALRASDRVTVEVLGASVESISVATRADWVRQEHPTARVVTAIDDADVDFESDSAWDEHMVVIESLLDRPVDAVFTSDAYGEELARRLGAAWVRVDPDRRENPVSGRLVRDDLDGHWHELSAPVREDLVRRVVLLGAESTGTTTLADELATRLGTVWVPEYGREHSVTREGGLETPWRDDEFDLIVDRQLRLEREAARRAPRSVIVCDTDPLATALWCERYLGRWSSPLHQRALAHPPLLYVLTGDEIPFVQDGLRDGEHIRHAMQQRFREVLDAQPVPWLEVQGTPAHRADAAIASIETALARPQFSQPIPTPGSAVDRLAR